MDERVARSAAATATVLGPAALACGLAALACGLPTAARAQAPVPPVRVEAAPEAEATAAADSTSFVSVIRVETPSARHVSVAEIIEREVGVRVRSAGGLGAFTAVSIRGADASEVAVFLDGVPLNRAASASVDLSQVPADGIERIEVYRGLAPPELGGHGLGGAINLISRKGARAPAWRASVGAGDFGTRSATLGHGFGGRALHADANVSYRGSDGDFPLYLYNGTLTSPGDDGVGIRRNNTFNQGSADIAVGGRAGERGTFRLGAHGFLKTQGVPGRASSDAAQTSHASFAVGRLLLDGALERRGLLGGAVDLRIGGHLLYERDLFNNRLGELVGTNGAARVDGETLAGGLEARVQAAVGEHELFTGLFSLAAEGFAPHDVLHAERRFASSSRLRAALVLADDLRLLADRLAITPSLRLDGIANQLATAIGTVGAQAQGNSAADAFASPQVGVRYRPLPWLLLRGSIGRYLRPPTTLELFGDGAFIAPRPSLRAETATAGEVGATLEGTAGPLGGFVEAVLFGRAVSDYIALVPSGRGALGAANAGDVRFLGVEATVRARLYGHLGLTAAYTFIQSSVTVSNGLGAAVGNAAPGVPEHKLDARAELTFAPFLLFYEVSAVSDAWLSFANVGGQRIPGRALHAIGGRAGPFPGWPVSFAVEVRNLADLRVLQWPLGGSIYRGQTAPYPLVDFFDYPLPGRAVYLTLTWQP